MSQQIIEFWAPWCRPCKQMAPVIERLMDERPDLDIQLINVDERPVDAANHNVGAVPTLIFIENGNEVFRAKGAHTYPALQKIVNDLFAQAGAEQ